MPPPSFLVIGHRGAAGHAPENTLPSFEAARSLGVQEVELDVRLSRDGVPVLFHDELLDRKTQFEGPVADRDAENLKQAKLGSWFAESHPGVSQRFEAAHLVTLPEVLGRFGEAFHYHIEIKTPDRTAPRRVLEVLELYGLRRHATITSFDLEQLGRARRLDPEIPITLLVEDAEDLEESVQVEEALKDFFGGKGQQAQQIQEAVNGNFQMVAFPARDLTPELVQLAHSRALGIRAWGVRDPSDLDRVIEVGADGATLDRPEWALDRRAP